MIGRAGECVPMDQPQVNTPGSPNDTPGSSNDIYANPPDVDHLELEPGHPGLNDAAYVERRRTLFRICREHRLNHFGPPVILYTDEEERIWREVTPETECAARAACQPDLPPGESRAAHQRGSHPAAARSERPSAARLGHVARARRRAHPVSGRSTPTSPSADSRSRSSSATGRSRSSRPSRT